MTRSESINELGQALAAAQAAIVPARKDSENPHFRSRYADLAAIWDACRAALSGNGLAVMQSPRLMPVGDLWFVELETLLLHTSGQWISDVLAVPVAPANAQAVGSAITYARRYSLAAFVGVAPDDDDGNSADRVVRDVAADRPVKPIPKPAPKGPASATLARVHVLGVVKRPAPDGAPDAFIVSADDHKTYTTTSADEARAAKAAKESNVPIEIVFRAVDGGRAIVSLRPVEVTR